MPAPPTFHVTLNELGEAFREIRQSATALPRSRWWKDILILGRLRARGDVNAWADVALRVPAVRSVGRLQAFQAMQDLFAMPAESILRTDRADGVWRRLGCPERVLVDPSSGQGAGSLTVVALGTPHCDRPEKNDPALTVALDDRCLWCNDAGAPCRCSDGRRIVEFNPFNDFGQQQGLACCYPKGELAAMSQSEAVNFVRAPRRQCPKWVPAGARCTVNDGFCASKGAGATGTGGPKVLLFDEEPGEGRRARRVVLAPGWVNALAGEASGDDRAKLPDPVALVTVVSWAKAAPAAASDPTVLARLQDLHDLVGHDVAFAATGA